MFNLNDVSRQITRSRCIVDQAIKWQSYGVFKISVCEWIFFFFKDKNIPQTETEGQH